MSTMKDIDALRKLARKNIMQAYALLKQAKGIADDIEYDSNFEDYAESYQLHQEAETLKYMLED